MTAPTGATRRPGVNPFEEVLFEVKRTIVIGQPPRTDGRRPADRWTPPRGGVPGLAKTLAVRTLAAAIGGQFQRIQFTPDLVPADLTGGRVLPPEHRRVRDDQGTRLHQPAAGRRDQPRPGQGTERLEVMQERQVTIGRETIPVPTPFLVLATQNPIESEGTYPFRGPGRPLHDEGRRGIPERRRGARHRAAVDRARSRARADAHPRGPGSDAGQGPRDLRRPCHRRLLRPTGHGDALTRRRGARRPGPLRDLWRQSARLDRPRGGARAPPSCAAATTCCRQTSATWRSTCCGTVSCSPTRPWPTTSTPTRSSPGPELRHRPRAWCCRERDRGHCARPPAAPPGVACPPPPRGQAERRLPHQPAWRRRRPGRASRVRRHRRCPPHRLVGHRQDGRDARPRVQRGPRPRSGSSSTAPASMAWASRTAPRPTS